MGLAIVMIGAARVADAGQSPTTAAGVSAPTTSPPPSAHQSGQPSGQRGEGTQSAPAVSTDRAAQDATLPNTQFPAWFLKSTRPIDPRVRPNVGLRVPMAYYPIPGGPLLYPNYSPVAPDFLGGQNTTPWSIRGSIALFGIDDERESAKFEEYRDLQDGTTAGLEARYRDGHTFFNLVGRQLGRGDQDLNMDGGRAGRLQWSAFYDETPHNFAFDTKTLFAGVGTDRLTVADAIQTDLQNSATNAELASKAAAYVAQQGVAIDQALRRQKVGAEATLVATYPWVVKASFTNESRDGERPWSGSFGFGHFDEIPWPVKYDTREVRLNAEWSKPESRYYASATYRLSDFVDHFSAVTWDNPFRISDTPTPGIGNALLGPASGRMSLYPSNTYHEVSGSTVIKRLPLKSTFNALVSLGYFRQDDPLLPFSTNTAAVDTLSSPVNPSFPATDLSGLPRGTAKTAMDSRTVHARWTGQLTNKLHFAQQYRLYSLVNNEEPFRFFMFVREDQDRRLPETQPGGTYLTVPADYAKHTSTSELSYNAPGDSRLSFAYTFERMNRDLREVEWMNDNKFKLAYDTRRFGWVELKAWYERAHRTTSSYEFDVYNIYQGNPSAHPMLPWLEKFDEAPFDRNEAQAMATFVLTDSTSVSTHVQLASTDYKMAELGALSRTTENVTAPLDPNNQFGVRWERRYAFGVDLTYVPSDRLSFFADAGYDHFKYSQGARQWTVNGITDPYLRQPVTESNANWTATPRDNYYSAGIGLDAQLIEQKLHLSVQYSYARSDGQHTYASPLGTAANDVNAFTPAPLDDVDDIRWHTFNPEIEYRHRNGLSLSAGYMLEKWDVSDYTYKGFTYTPLYNNGVALLMGALLPPAYNVNVLYVRARVGF